MYRLGETAENKSAVFDQPVWTTGILDDRIIDLLQICISRTIVSICIFQVNHYMFFHIFGKV